MDTTASAVTLTLDRAQYLRVPRPEGLCLQVTRGTLWITVDGRADDIELAAGQRLCFDGAAPVVIGTLGGTAEFRAQQPAASRQPRLAWV